MSRQRAALFANGSLSDPQAARALLQNDDVIVAADGGAAHALACRRPPDVLIGDLDSIPPSIRASLERSGTRILQYPAEKDQTDLELALDFSVREGFHRMLIVGGLGGRTDQTLANLSLLLRPDLEERDVRMDDGREEVLFIRREAVLHGARGHIVSLLPFGSEARGVATEGLQYPLRGETLFPHQARGVSNRMTGTRAVVRLEGGSLLCIHTRSSDTGWADVAGRPSSA
jgi:thiamine pyrophosphokinase